MGNISMDESFALDLLHGASQHIAEQFYCGMSHAQAKANLEARAVIFGCCNSIFKAHGCGISRAEIEETCSKQTRQPNPSTHPIE